ncbi:hypothetical protein KM043_003870 [Ampulex compressa]|nr:hypothetical protein KM043_003870 [Ampulex compressa]
MPTGRAPDTLLANVSPVVTRAPRHCPEESREIADKAYAPPLGPPRPPPPHPPRSAEEAPESRSSPNPAKGFPPSPAKMPPVRRTPRTILGPAEDGGPKDRSLAPAPLPKAEGAARASEGGCSLSLEPSD